MADILHRKFYALIADPAAKNTFPASFEDAPDPVNPPGSGNTGIVGPGTLDRLAKFTSANTIGDSVFYEDSIHFGVVRSTGSFRFPNSGENRRGIEGRVSTDDFWYIGGGQMPGGISDRGFLEIATGDNGTEPIFIRQYLGPPTASNPPVVNQIELLDASGNSRFPGTMRIDTINNLGTASTNVLVPNGTGVLHLRTVTQLLADMDGVPYTGATKNVTLGDFGISVNHLNFDTTPASLPTSKGTTYWDVDDDTIATNLGGFIMKHGEDQSYPVKNQTGAKITKGTTVGFAGTLGASGRLLIEKFIANNSVQSSRFMGVAAQDIENGEDGKVLWFGRIRGINTSAYNEGDILYASPTVAGALQTTQPLAPNNIVQVAAVITKSANVGTIFVRPIFGSNINKNEAIKITTPAQDDIFRYQSSTGIWENKQLVQYGLVSSSVKFTSTNVYTTVFGTGENITSGDLDAFDITKIELMDVITVDITFNNYTNNTDKIGILRFSLDGGTNKFLEIGKTGTDPYSGKFTIKIIYLGADAYAVYGNIYINEGELQAGNRSVFFSQTITTNWDFVAEFFSGVIGSGDYGGRTDFLTEVYHRRPGRGPFVPFI